MEAADKPVKSIVFPLYLVSGDTKQGGMPITIAYVGHDQQKILQWSALIMDSASKHYLGDYPLVGLIKYLKERHPVCSMMLVEKDLPGGIADIKEASFSLPFFMKSYIDISIPIKKLNKRNRVGYNDSMRLIRKYNLSYEIVNSPEAQHDFYYNMYLPYQRSRHGETFQVVAMHNVFSKEIPFEIFRIKNGNEVVAAVVVRYKENDVYLSFLGIKNGAFDHVKNGAIGAIYYFACDELHKRGYSNLYLGGSPPFIHHPLTKYKSRMNALVNKDYLYNDHELTSFFFLRNSSATRDFLSNSPFIFVNKSKQIAGAVWLCSGRYSTGVDFEKEINRVFKLGLNECQIIYWGKKPKLKAGSEEFENKIIHFVHARKYFDNRFIMVLRKIDNKFSDFLKASFRGFDETGYLAANPDVAQAVKEGKFSSGRHHYLKYGKREGRSIIFSATKS